MQAIRRGLVSSANLKRLTLAYNNLTPASAVILSLLLYKYENPPSALSLTELDLQGNSLGVEILEELAKVLGALISAAAKISIIYPAIRAIRKLDGFFFWGGGGGKRQVRTKAWPF